MGRYIRPAVRTETTRSLIELWGPVQTAYTAEVGIYGGAYDSARLGNYQMGEHRYVKTNLEYGLITKKEVDHA